MKVILLNAQKTHAALTRLISEFDEIQIAVAWGYNGELANLLIKNESKIRSVTFGLNGFATSPDLVERLIDVKNAFVAKADNGVFHPKIYYFRRGQDVEAIIGSSNFTNGGLGRNHEACLHLVGSTQDSIFDEIQREFFSYEALKQSVTKELSDIYRRQHNAARKTHILRDPILPKDRKSHERLISPLATLGWDEFAQMARRDPHHDFGRRIRLLRKIQGMFAGHGKFSDLLPPQQKAIAGTLKQKEAKAEDLGDHDWGWFGTMSGNGSFASLIKNNSPELGAAVDCIPWKGPVTLTDFNTYCIMFRQAFKNSNDHIGRYPTATRLLAMKRPDIFVCINGKNNKNLAKALNFAPNTLSLENYWDRVIVPIQFSPWFNEQRPRGNDSVLWDYRVAMLDTIYYDQDQS